MQKINLNIPGWNGREILEIIGHYSSNVPVGGNILELGALFGRTTATIGYCKPTDVNLYTIDIWSGMSRETLNGIITHDNTIGELEKELITRLIDETTDKLLGNDVYLSWKVFTSSIDNLHGVRGFTNTSTDEFPNFDLIIHDAAHDYEHVYEDLTNWFPKLKTEGVIIIDDYDIQFPGVIQAVDQFVVENDLLTEMVTSRNILLKRK